MWIEGELRKQERIPSKVESKKFKIVMGGDLSVKRKIQIFVLPSGSN